MLQGGRHVNGPKVEVLAFLSDPRLFSSCVGNVENLRVKVDGRFSAKFRVDIPERFGVSYLERASANMNFAPVKYTDMIEWQGSGRIVGVKLSITLGLDVREEDGGARLSWRASLDAGIIEKVLGEENLERFASDLASRILECISARVGS